MQAATGMQYRPLGRTGLRVSAVGFGTCQLRLVPEEQALATLRRGFELGVNLVHTAPDYEGADALVARAVRESGREVIVLSQGYGDAAHFAWLFEETCRRLGRARLELFGIACVEDRVALGENVFGPGGMVEQLQALQRAGRLGGIFATTHGTPDYVARLIASGVFDALMLAYNPLGFHLLSARPDALRPAEDFERLRRDVFPLAARLGVGLMVMKPLAGGLLSPGKAFPPRAPLLGDAPRIPAGDLLRLVLESPEVACVVPGTASPEEAEENALAGHAEGVDVSGSRRERWAAALSELQATLCSRCGLCEPTCSRGLPISWLFRDAYLQGLPSETFEVLDDLHYFHLHPSESATCASCDDVTCHCPAGLDLPRSLTRLHDHMLGLRRRGLLQALPGELAGLRDGALGAAVVSRDVPDVLAPGQPGLCRVYVENLGAGTWRAGRVTLRVSDGVRELRRADLRHDVERGARAHFVFALRAPAAPGRYRLRFALADGDGALDLFTSTLRVPPARGAARA
jgi:predicted aldo/keto reductase-like oxidoreductase